jgi:hypothetical protein
MSDADMDGNTCLLQWCRAALMVLVLFGLGRAFYASRVIYQPIALASCRLHFGPGDCLPAAGACDA